MSNNEKRKYRRLRNGVRVIYKVMGMGGESIKPVIDVGGGGLKLHLNDRLKSGELLELGLLVPENKDPFFVLARVAWQSQAAKKSADGGEYYETGIEFLKLDVHQRMHLIHYVYEKLKEKGEQ